MQFVRKAWKFAKHGVFEYADSKYFKNQNVTSMVTDQNLKIQDGCPRKLLFSILFFQLNKEISELEKRIAKDRPECQKLAKKVAALVASMNG